MKVDYIDHLGTDLSVVNAARVSFDKQSAFEDYCLSCGSTDLRYTNIWKKFVCSECNHEEEGDVNYIRVSEADTKLIKYLADHDHWSPFAHPQVSIRVKAPIFVARQLAKHQVGFAWNEVSRRYVDSEPEFYQPEVWREKADNVKQGSRSSGLTQQEVINELASVEECWGIISTPPELYEECRKTYQGLLDLGVCPEQARMVLPQSMYTEWIWTGSLLGWSRVCKLRLDSHTQKETQEVAQMIEDIVKPLFPVSWSALCS
jgi:thymidylate synthase (FAD)